MRNTSWVMAFSRFSGAAVLILASSNAFAGENVWTSNGPLGAVTALASDSTGTYAGTYLEGRNAAYRSLDHGASWTAIGEAPESTSISTLTVDPINSARVYATVSFLSAIPSLVLERIFRSEDRGSSWVQVGLFNGTILDLAIRPEDPETLYGGGLACYCVGFPCLYLNECSASVMKSVDAGVSWSLLGTRLGGSIVTAVALDPHDPARMYAGGDAGASVSSDNGAHWSPRSRSTPRTRRSSTPAQTESGSFRRTLASSEVRTAETAGLRSERSRISRMCSSSSSSPPEG
jgi:hypothetical protein